MIQNYLTSKVEVEGDRQESAYLQIRRLKRFGEQITLPADMPRFIAIKL